MHQPMDDERIRPTRRLCQNFCDKFKGQKESYDELSGISAASAEQGIDFVSDLTFEVVFIHAVV
jgi:hypothetical protein